MIHNWTHIFKNLSEHNFRNDTNTIFKKIISLIFHVQNRITFKMVSIFPFVPGK